MVDMQYQEVMWPALCIKTAQVLELKEAKLAWTGNFLVESNLGFAGDTQGVSKVRKLGVQISTAFAFDGVNLVVLCGEADLKVCFLC